MKPGQGVLLPQRGSINSLFHGSGTNSGFSALSSWNGYRRRKEKQKTENRSQNADMF
jgi:hypothetical protein